ncbi:hypothetical protein J2772_000825 [Chryseobacterium jejuense]|nr:hypothetical protein [Chryseobacterium jejuense]
MIFYVNLNSVAENKGKCFGVMKYGISYKMSSNE